MSIESTHALALPVLVLGLHDLQGLLGTSAGTTMGRRSIRVVTVDSVLASPGTTYVALACVLERPEEAVTCTDFILPQALALGGPKFLHSKTKSQAKSYE